MSREKAKKIKMLVLDVDGVLTDGIINYGNFADNYRCFHVHDGFGIRIWHKQGFKTAVISGKKSNALKRRVKDLKINMLYAGYADKLKAFRQILKKYKLKNEEVCFVGDDLFDLPVMINCGFSATVPEACAEVRDSADYVTQKGAGRGAVREVIEFIFKAQDKWDAIVSSYKTSSHKT